MEHVAVHAADALWSRDEFPATGSAMAVEPPTSVEQFSTLGVQTRKRIEMWEEHNARALVGLQARTLNGKPLEATEVNLRLPQLQLAHVSANAHVVERDAQQIERTPGDAVALYFTLFGESFFYYKDGVHLQRPGGLLVCDIQEPFMRGFAQGLQEFALVVPRTTFEEIADDVVPRQPITMDFARIPGANAHAAALARLIRSTFADPTPDQLTAAEAGALDLMRAIFSSDTSRNAAGYRLSALAFIERHLRDPRLSVGSVARGIGVSERHLSRLFSETGTGVARVILERRLDLARRILSRPGSPAVGEVAGQCGFSSHAHFTRVFRERFEETPAQFRSSVESARSL